MEQIHHKKNECFEVECFEDAECTEAFNFTNAKDLYIQLVNGDVTPFMALDIICPANRNLGITAWTPYLPQNIKIITNNLRIKTLDDITPNLSKYIPEDNAVLFLSEENKEKYPSLYDNNICCFSIQELETWELKFLNDKGEMEIPKKATIFISHGTESELQKANEIAKELKEKYGVDEVDLLVLHNFHHNGITYNDNTMYLKGVKTNVFFNKLITTNSTGILKPEDSNERLQVIDCKNIIEDYLKENN